MKKNIGIFLTALSLCFMTMPTYALDSASAAKGLLSDNIIERRAFNAPDHVSNNMNHLVQYLTHAIKSDYDKLKVIAYWIASHLAYDSYKFDNENVSIKEMNYKYDVLKAKMGICSDFAKLFTDMAQAAHISADVETVGGYVITPQRFKKYYNKQEMPPTGHAWNKVTIGRRQFFVDTTFMCPNRVGHDNRKRKSSLKHRREVRKRNVHKTQVSTNINPFYFDFTPKQEFKIKKEIHLLDKYVH